MSRAAAFELDWAASRTSNRDFRRRVPVLRGAGSSLLPSTPFSAALISGRLYHALTPLKGVGVFADAPVTLNLNGLQSALEGLDGGILRWRLSPAILTGCCADCFAGSEWAG